MTPEKMPVRVSVILSTYNSEKTLQRALDSVLSQEGIHIDFEIELIVVDDCSTDRTREILEENKIGYVSTGENSGGPNRGRNIGLNRATGDFFCIMDHDDEWLPDKLVSQLAVSHLAPIISSGLTVIFRHRNRSADNFNQPRGDAGYNFYGKNVTFLTTLCRSTEGQASYIGSMLINSSLKHFRFEENFGKVDYDWGLKVFEGNCSVEVCRPLYKRYVEESNLSLNTGYRSVDFYFSLMILDGYSERYPAEARSGYKRLHGSRARFYYLTGNMKKARFYFARSGWNIKTLLYYLTTFAGSRFVRKTFTVFG
ncbi:MAG: glycosyltransferase family 2 protein [Bacteroidota bacterium]